VSLEAKSCCHKMSNQQRAVGLTAAYHCWVLLLLSGLAEGTESGHGRRSTPSYRCVPSDSTAYTYDLSGTGVDAAVTEMQLIVASDAIACCVLSSISSMAGCSDDPANSGTQPNSIDGATGSGGGLVTLKMSPTLCALANSPMGAQTMGSMFVAFAQATVKCNVASKVEQQYAVVVGDSAECERIILSLEEMMVDDANECYVTDTSSADTTECPYTAGPDADVYCVRADSVGGDVVASIEGTVGAARAPSMYFFATTSKNVCNQVNAWRRQLGCSPAMSDDNGRLIYLVGAPGFSLGEIQLLNSIQLTVEVLFGDQFVVSLPRCRPPRAGATNCCRCTAGVAIPISSPFSLARGIVLFAR
jgi:hypothetical protein